MTQPNPLDLADRLSQRGVTYAIIGGHAVNYHGYLRATEDIDLVFLRDPAGELAVYETLLEFNGYWITDELDHATGLEKTIPISLEYVKTHHLMMLGTRVGYVDLFDFLPGLDNAELGDFFASVEVSQGRRFTSLAWLKRLKQAANRLQDRLDLERLP
jgi:hypothetical protein